MKITQLIFSDDVKAIAHSNPKEFHLNNKNYYYSTCRISNGSSNENVYGFGVSTTRHFAEIKSTMEALERKSFFDAGSPIVNSSAAGFLGQNLKNRLLLEAIERDALLRWCLDQIGHEYISLPNENGYSQLKICSPAEGAFVIMSLVRMENCYAFGLGCSTRILTARAKADEELVTSLVQHSIRGCNTGSVEYNQLHQNTNSFNFLSRVSTRKLNKTLPKVNVRQKDFTVIYPKQQYGPFLKVAFGTVDKLLKWDIDWIFEKGNYASLNKEEIISSSTKRNQLIVSG